jgi:hypothetical protein
MTRPPSLFRQRDVTAAIKAALAAGAQNCVVEIARNGTIRVIVSPADTAVAEKNPWDDAEA